uniref:Uncharacterized protein n=1 Tax=Ditylenchus dipsaci TaxID=166011 RepID=A0A915EKQ2_9BILA
MDNYHTEKGNLLGCCSGYSMTFCLVRLRDGSHKAIMQYNGLCEEYAGWSSTRVCRKGSYISPQRMLSFIVYIRYLVKSNR